MRRRLLTPFLAFAHTESASGIVLLAVTAFALLWANSPVAESYHAVWWTPLRRVTLHALINDGVMTVFFLLVGLEIKRELVAGELADRRRAALPMVAALGGMIAPAAIYAIINRGTPAIAGWGIPMATDIAFALGVLALLGDRVPSGLRVFLAALAIVDDIGAVLVIALFYTSHLSWPALGATVAILAGIVVLQRRGMRSPWAYAACGIVVWIAVLRSGVHATVAGVLLAITVPATSRDEGESTLLRMERGLHSVVAFVIMPLFALANAGVSLHADAIARAVRSPITLGIALGLALGKPIGIAGAAWLAVRLGIADRPAGASWRPVFGVGILGGIGFTMALFVAGLAFDPTQLDVAKVGVLGASALAGAFGWWFLRSSLPARE